MHIRYRHYEAILRRGWDAVFFGRITEAELLERHAPVFDAIAKELLESPLQRIRTYLRHVLSLIFPVKVFPFHPNTPLGNRGQTAYFGFRLWLKHRLA